MTIRLDEVHNDLWLAVDLWKMRGLVARLKHPSRVALLRSCNDLKRRIGVLHDQLRQRTPVVPSAAIDRGDPARGTCARSAAPSLSMRTTSSPSGFSSISGPPRISDTGASGVDAGGSSLKQRNPHVADSTVSSQYSRATYGGIEDHFHYGCFPRPSRPLSGKRRV